MKSNPWHTQNHFLNLLALACAANYKGESPNKQRPKEGEELIGTANETARCLNALRVDLLAKRAELQGKNRQATRTVMDTLRNTPRSFKGLAGTLTSLAGFAKEAEEVGSQAEALDRQIYLVGILTHAVLVATMPELATQKRDALFICDDGNVYGAAADEDTESYAIPQDHLVRQIGQRVVLIIAGEDRLEEVLGIANPPRAFSTCFGEIEELEAQAQLGDLPQLAAIGEDEVILRRISGLLNAVTEASFGASLSIATVGSAQRSLTEACEAASFVKSVFWAIAKERYEGLAGKERLQLREDWAIVQEEPSMMEELIGSALDAIPAGLRGGIRLVVAGMPKGGCDDPDCEVCHAAKAGDEQAGEGEREPAPTAATAGA